MSRLRARTWTARERIAAFFAQPRVYLSHKWPPKCVLNAIRYRRPTHEEAVKIHEHTMRTKGIVATYALQQAEDAQWVSRRPYLAMRRIVRSAAWCRRTRTGFIPSDSNPNIYVRRDA